MVQYRKLLMVFGQIMHLQLDRQAATDGMCLNHRGLSEREQAKILR